MPNGVYIYCILDEIANSALGGMSGIGGGKVRTINYKDIYAAVSEVPYKEASPGIEEVVAHNKVVEAARISGTVLPVRFGVIFKGEEGAIKLLKTSYPKYKLKLEKFRGKDELGLKIVLEKESIKKIEALALKESEEARKLSSQSIKAGKGTSYFLKLKLEDAVRNEALRKISEISGTIHEELAKLAEEALLLKTELDQVVLNSVYLVSLEKQVKFRRAASSLEKKYEPSGFTFHLTGPWAPYSFC